jgi:hypothetical protein
LPNHVSAGRPRKGLEGFSHAAGGAGARTRGAPESPVRPEGPDAPKDRGLNDVWILAACCKGTLIPGPRPRLKRNKPLEIW